MAKVRAPNIDVLLASGLISPEDIGTYQGYDQQYNDTVNPADTANKTLFHDLGFQMTPGGQFGGLDPTNVFGAYQGNLRSLADTLAANRASNIQRGLHQKGLGAAKERYIRMATDAQNTGLINQAQGSLSGFNTLQAGAEGKRTGGKNNFANSLLGKYLIDAPDDTSGPGADPGATPPTTPPPSADTSPFAGPNVLGKGAVLDTPAAPFTPTGSPGTPALTPGAQVDPGISMANLGGQLPSYITNPYANGKVLKKGGVL